MKIIKVEIKKKRVEGTEKERDTKRGKRSMHKQKKRGGKCKAQDVCFLEGGRQ